MNSKDWIHFLAALDAALEAVPDLVAKKHIQNLHRLRGIFELMQQIKQGK
jgi:hypothetical protein